MFVEEKTEGEIAPAKLDEASELLLKAAALIERDGWCQNELSTDDGRMCVSGALMKAAYGEAKGRDHFMYPPSIRTAWRRLESAGAPIPQWNDYPLRTQDEVVAKLRAVALMPRG